MNVRMFKGSDASAIADLSNKSGDAFQYKSVTPDFIAQMCSSRVFKMFVLEDSGKVVGFCGVNLQSPLLAELGPICVEAPFRKRGAGRILSETAFEFLCSKRVKTVVIKVKASNMPAQEFFKSLGFSKTDDVLCGGEPAMMMAKKF